MKNPRNKLMIYELRVMPPPKPKKSHCKDPIEEGLKFLSEKGQEEISLATPKRRSLAEKEKVLAERLMLMVLSAVSIYLLLSFLPFSLLSGYNDSGPYCPVRHCLRISQIVSIKFGVLCKQIGSEDQGWVRSEEDRLVRTRVTKWTRYSPCG